MSPRDVLRTGALSRRLALSAFAASLVVALLVSAAQVGLRYRDGMREADARLREIERTYAPNLSASLWEANDAATARLLDGIAAMPHVAALSLTDEGGQIQSRRRAGVRGRIIASAALPLRLREGGQAFALGRLQVQMDDAAIMADLASQAAAIALTFALALLCSALCIALLFDRLVGRHLAAMAEHVRRGDAAAPLHLRRRARAVPDELDYVVSAINAMAEQVRRDRSDQSASAERLRLQRDQLEQAVAQRSAAVERQNLLLQDALRDNAALLAAIEQYLPYAAIDADGNILAVNARLADCLGHASADLVGQALGLLQAPGQTPWRGLWAQVRAGQPWSGETCLLARDGSRRWFDCVAAPFFDGSGRISRVVLLGADITLRKATEADLNRANLMLSSVLDAATDVSIIATDTNGMVTVFNAGAERITGYRAADMLGRRTPLVLHDPAELAARAAALQQAGAPAPQGFAVLAADSGAPMRRWSLVRKDGTRLRAATAVTALRGPGNAVDGFLFVAQDVTQQEMQHLQLLATRDQLSTAASVANLGIWSWNAATGEVQWNSRNYEIFDLPADAHGEHRQALRWRSRLHPDDVAKAESALGAALADGTPFALALRVVGADGHVRHVQSAGRVETDASGRGVRVIGINRDVSGQIELEAHLRAAKEQAELASRAKSEFVANMSHEIRTPLNAVLGVAQLLARSQMTAAQRESVEMILGAGQSLLGILNDILDFSKLEAGRMDLARLSFRVDDLVAPLAAIMVASAGAKELELVIGIDPAVPSTLVGDPLRIQQILVNLLGNALKFTARGQVSLLLDVAEQQAGGIVLGLVVGDTGIGMSPTQLAALYKPFGQADSSITREFGGTGLGLSISKQLVEIMGGSIAATSEPGRGTVFAVRLPLGVAASERAAPLDGKSLLVVDPNPQRRDYLCRSLRASGAAAIGLETAPPLLPHGCNAVLAAWRGPADDEQLAALARLSAPGRSVPLLALCRPQVRDAFAAASRPGAARALGQPVLGVAVAAALDSATAAPGDAPEQATPLQGLRLLLVEDNELNQFVASGMLEHAGATVELAANGQEALALLRARRYDLVLMDVQMPVMDGLSATRAARAELGLELPIVAMTAGVMESERSACRAAGMDGMVAKPVEYQLLIEEIGRQLGRLPGS